MIPNSLHSAPPASFREIADVLYQSLQEAVTEQCMDRLHVRATVDRLERTSADQLMRVHIECPEQVEITARITVREIGGTVYDIRCAIEDGNLQRFLYNLPRHSETGLLRATRLGQKIATFLVDELEQQRGYDLLPIPA